MTAHFQAGIGALIRRADTKEYLLLQRSAAKDVGAGHWECVTGRVDQGESFETTLHREVREELGINVMIDFIVKTSHFYRGEPIVENELLSVIYACTIDNPDDIVTSSEHSKSRWTSAAEIYHFLDESHWLTLTVQRAEAIYAHMPSVLLDYFHEHGYE